MHHVASFVPSLSTAIEEFGNAGVELAARAMTRGGGEFAFVDTSKIQGHLLELYEPSERLVGFYEFVRNASQGLGRTRSCSEPLVSPRSGRCFAGSPRYSSVMAYTLDLNPDQLLTTTRAVRRRLDFDRPVPQALVEECLEVAIQAPSGSNARGWHFVIVGDPKKRKAIGDLYRQAFDQYRTMPFSAHALAEQAKPEETGTMNAVVTSAETLAENLHRAPWLAIACQAGRVPAMEGPMGHLSQASVWGSVAPAFWSFMLAARARGLGTAWTTLHLMFEREIADLLGIPFDEVMQAALSPVAFTVGTDFKAAANRGLEDVLHVDGW